MGTQETIGQGFIFPQKPQKQVLSFDVGRTELAGLIARKEDDAPGFLRIALKHNALPLDPSGREGTRFRSTLPEPWTRSHHETSLYSLCNHRATKPKDPNVLITLPKEPPRRFGECLTLTSFSHVLGMSNLLNFSVSSVLFQLVE